MRFLYLAALAATSLLAQNRTLDIYWIDVEGGGATLIVTPAGESLLVDTGNPGERDTNRIVEVATKQAGLKKIDHLLTTHFHSDHVGSAPTVAKLLPIGDFIDHGDSVEAQAGPGKALYDAYKAAAGSHRTIVKPGDAVPMKGVKVEIVSAGGLALQKPINGGGRNSFCEGAKNKEADKGENGQSTGFLLTYGKFTFLNLGDLTWDREMALACPDNKVGVVTLVQATHHGFFEDYSGAPALYNATKPQLVVVNNGASKGLQPSAYELISHIDGIRGVWQVHQSVGSDASHNTTEDRVANNEAADAGHWLKASVTSDGTVTMLNSRNNYSESYKPR